MEEQKRDFLENDISRQYYRAYFTRMEIHNILLLYINSGEGACDYQQELEQN